MTENEQTPEEQTPEDEPDKPDDGSAKTIRIVAIVAIVLFIVIAIAAINSLIDRKVEGDYGNFSDVSDEQTDERAELLVDIAWGGLSASERANVCRVYNSNPTPSGRSQTVSAILAQIDDDGGLLTAEEIRPALSYKLREECE